MEFPAAATSYQHASPATEHERVGIFLITTPRAACLTHLARLNPTKAAISGQLELFPIASPHFRRPRYQRVTCFQFRGLRMRESGRLFKKNGYLYTRRGVYPDIKGKTVLEIPIGGSPCC